MESKWRSFVLSIAIFFVMILCICSSVILYNLFPSLEGIIPVIEIHLHKNTITPAVSIENISTNIPTIAAQNQIKKIPKKTQDIGVNETINTLRDTIVPQINLNDIVMRLKNKSILKSNPSFLLKNYQNGDFRKFWVLNSDKNTYSSILARLEYVTPHLYFWVNEKVSFDKNALQKLALTFENKIYPTDREYFGTESPTGIDIDPHLSVLYTNDMGSAAGYFNSADLVSPEVDNYSNSSQLLYLSSEYLSLSNDYTYGVLAHEFQHLIMWFHDRNESSWVSEGFSELAVNLNGYDIGGFDYLFAENPNLQLNFWPGDGQGDSSPHYGAAFLFFRYFLDRFGENATRALVANPNHGLESVDATLSELNIWDPINNQTLNADEFFRDWTVTNVLQSNVAEDGRYVYRDYRAPLFQPNESLMETDDWKNQEVNQFGTNYYQVNCDRDCRILFQGDALVKVLPVDPHSGNYYVWSNKGDESDMTLWHDFDFTQIKGPITLNYFNWYDIEKDYDYLYLSAKDERGNWKVIKIPGCTDTNPTGSNYGCGITGKSDGWVRNSVDLSQFAGKKITIQFEYITDLAVNGEGFVLDDVSIPELGYSTDFENDLSGWLAKGFVRIQNKLPQKFLVTLIRKEGSIVVDHLQIDENGYVIDPIIVNKETDKFILIISGDTRYTRQPAEYRIKTEVIR